MKPSFSLDSIDLSQKKIIAVAGTLGKTTTIHLLKQMLEKNGSRVECFGKDFRSLEQISSVSADYYLLKISYHDLKESKKFKPWMAILLNLYPPNERIVGGFEAYVNVFANLFVNQTQNDWLFFDLFQKNVQTLIAEKKPKARLVSLPREPNQGSYDQEGLYVEDKKLVWRSSDGVLIDYSLQKFSQNLGYAPLFFDMLAAVSVANLCQVKPLAIQKTLDEFKGVSGRLQKLKTIQGVQLIDDSAALSFAASSWAVVSFPNPIWICGGDYVHYFQLDGLARHIGFQVKKVIVLGKARFDLAIALEPLGEVELANDLDDAVKKAIEGAQEGDSVIFSPGCYPQNNYESSWGDAFKNAVKKFEASVRGLQGPRTVRI